MKVNVGWGVLTGCEGMVGSFGVVNGVRVSVDVNVGMRVRE